MEKQKYIALLSTQEFDLSHFQNVCSHLFSMNVFFSHIVDDDTIACTSGRREFTISASTVNMWIDSQNKEIKAINDKIDEVQLLCDTLPINAVKSSKKLKV